MNTTIFALALTLASGNALAYDADENNRFRIDQDEVTMIDSNMMWSNNCEFQLNNRVSRTTAITDGKVIDTQWKDTMGVLCDHSMGFVTSSGI